MGLSLLFNVLTGPCPGSGTGQPMRQVRDGTLVCILLEIGSCWFSIVHAGFFILIVGTLYFDFIFECALFSFVCSLHLEVQFIVET